MVGNNRLNCFLCDYDLCTECCIVAEKQVTAGQMCLDTRHRSILSKKRTGVSIKHSDLYN